MWVRLLLRYGQSGFVKLPKVLVNFRLHESSKTTSNNLVNNFLIERSSIIVHLQKNIGSPQFIIEYYLNDVFKAQSINKLNKSWEFNSSILSKRHLNIYFAKKYIVSKFLRKETWNAFKGIKLLVKYCSFDIFLLRSLIKTIAK